MASSSSTPSYDDPARWTIARLKDWLRQHSRNAPIGGTRLQLVAHVNSVMRRDELEAELEAAEVQVHVSQPPDYSILPREDSTWSDDVENFPKLDEDVVESYLKQFSGYTKGWNTGVRLVSDGHLTGLCYFGEGGRGFFKGRCKPTMCSIPPFYKPFVVVDVPDETDGESLQILGGNCTCKAGQTQSCVHICALIIMVSFLGEQSCTSKPCYWVRPSASGTTAQAVTFAKNLDLGHVGQAKEWEGEALCIDDLESLFIEAEVSCSWTDYRKIERENREKSVSSELQARISIVDPVAKL